MPSHGQYTTEQVEYPSHGETIAGILFKPTNISKPPAVVITGPYSFMKEQAPFQYGTRLADEGFAALIFDPRSVGGSTGQPRRLENPKMKNEDAVAGLDYLVSRGDIDASKLFLAGICQGGPQSLDIASYDDRVVGVASVSGYFRDHETDVYMIWAGCVNWKPGDDIGAMKMPTPEQGEALYQARLERAKKAREEYENSGKVQYQPLVDPQAADPTTGALAGLPGPVVWSWYGPWTLKGFENRYAVMSDLDHFGYTTAPGVAKLNKPALIIHGDNCMNPPAAKRHFESIPIERKKLIWNNEVTHFQHYDQPDCVDRNVGEIAAWFASYHCMCKFLGKEIPDEEFPKVNDTAAFAAKEGAWHKRNSAALLMNMSVFVSVVAVGVAAISSYRRSGRVFEYTTHAVKILK